VKEYPPLEAYLRDLLLVRLEPNPSSVSFVSKQILRLPWSDPSQQCGALVCKIMLKACVRGRYKAIEAIAAVASKLRTQRAAGEVTIRLIDAVIEELRWALEHPNFRDQQRVITYVRLLGELYCSSQVSGQIILDQLYDFINVGHEIPPALREASKKIASTQADGKGGDDKKLPVYNSSVSGVSGAIQEDEEMEDSNLETKEEVAPPKPVAVSQYSKYDPRVPTQVDLPNSPYRIAMVCTLLEVVAPTIVSRNMLPRLKNFLVAFQRYLFTKAFLPTDVEFILLDTFDVLDSQWKRVSKSQRNAADGGESESGFPRYQTWLEAHNSTVAAEEAEALFEIQKRQRLEALADESKSLADMEGLSLNDDETGSMLDEDDDATLSVASGKESASEGIEEEEVDRDGETAGEVDEEGYELGASEDDEEEESEYGETEEEEEEDEFDEDAHMKQLEEEAFDRELRRVTMDALEKGKNASRKQVGDSMISGSQISRKKLGDPSKATDASAALSGKAGVSFQLLKKGNKGKVETKEIVVPVDTNLAMVATKQDDEAARERDEIKQRVLQYEGKMAEAEYSGGNVYLEQEKLQVIRNKPLSIEEIDKNFGTTGGTLIQPPDKKKSSQGQQGSRSASSSSASAGRGRGGRGGRGHGGRGPGRGRGGRSSTGGRTLYG
jgi:regulator of nonsense transcripts 2